MKISEQIRDQQLQQFEILKNIEHIKYLKGIGQYGNNQQKIGMWKTFWSGEALVGIGGAYGRKKQKQIQKYYIQKMEKSKDNGINYSQISPMLESGEYLNDQKIKLWKYTLENEEIGGGLYENQLKQGQWIELFNNFSFHSQITLNGEYNNGKKVGKWGIYHRKGIHQQFQFIGGGSYDNQEGRDSFKIGKWLELSDGFHSDNQVMYEGEYKNGIKVGKWEIQMIHNKKKIYLNQQAENHLGIKQGKWYELNDLLQNSIQIIYYGEYKNGIKVGRWETYWEEKNKRSLIFMQNQWREQISKSYKLIGGGLYDEKLDGQFVGGIKQGR
ncbi:unnamed protein product [Paramecium pentaurelia]|uniref:Uncharacterized protein n=1 Tax=Paramecium pentaurelia TaxID=43138 RepID=A0A8S1V607_9CILI|nr:unnamed protein product [Paramecium pentaurelia]